jgi:hypothetical protein
MRTLGGELARRLREAEGPWVQGMDDGEYARWAATQVGRAQPTREDGEGPVVFIIRRRPQRPARSGE